VTLGEYLRTAARRLEEAGVEAPRRDARLLLSAVLDRDPSFVIAHGEDRLDESDRAGAEAMISRRVRREPVSRILGQREFWSLSLKVTPDTLDPRPDSETLVAAALQLIDRRDQPLRILDLGTGTGCLLLALLSELPAASGLGVDISEGSLEVARDNACSLGLASRARFRQGCWGEGLSPGWSLIVSNPPYIDDASLAGLPPEVARYDPPGALAAGPDGLAAYRALLPQAARLLAPGGFLALEIGNNQSADVKDLIAAYGLCFRLVARDLGGIERCLIADGGTVVDIV
jgi:release factor glutamine methyltransferase